MLKNLLTLLMGLVVLFLGACIPRVPTTGVSQPPMINTFDAEPASISGGESATLSWDVSGATKVSIEPDVGNVALRGRRVVSPAVTTTYTLTAKNAAGSVTASTQVVVAAPPPPADTTPPSTPVLASPAPGAVLPQKTSPWSFTWSASSDPESGVKQYHIQVYRAGQPPFIEDYTPATSYSKTVEVAYGSLANWRWRVRAQNNVGLWSAWSTERSFTVEPRVAYDFIEKAPTAYWWSTPGEQLPFPGALNDNRGFACYRTNIALNDGKTYTKVLETHPKWVDNGWISGKYSGVYIPAGSKLKVKVGIISGGTAGKIRLRVNKLGESSLWSPVIAYGDGVKEAEIDLGAYANQTVDFVIGVDAEGSSAQDWAAWVEAKIVY